METEQAIICLSNRHDVYGAKRTEGRGSLGRERLEAEGYEGRRKARERRPATERLLFTQEILAS